LRGLEHLHEGNAHTLGDGGDIFEHWHIQPVYRKPYFIRRIWIVNSSKGTAEGSISKAVKVPQIGNRDQKKARSRRRSAELGPFQLRQENCMQFRDQCLLCLSTRCITRLIPCPTNHSRLTSQLPAGALPGCA
jgi:hypothetical protein